MIVDRVELANDEARVYLSQGLWGAPADAVRRAARSVADTFADTAEHVALVQANLSGRLYEQRFSAAELGRSTIIDYLFEGLESVGIEARGIEFSHTEATLYVTRLPNDQIRAKAALFVLNAAPTPIETVSMVALEVDVSRVSLSRDEVRRSAAVHNMFDGLEAHGFTVESIDITRRTATVAVSTPRHQDASAYREAAAIVADSGAAGFDEITVVGSREGSVEARLSVRVAGRDGIGAGSGQEAAREHAVAANDTAARIFEALSEEGVSTDALHLTPTAVTVFVTPRRFRQLARGIGRVARAVANNAPPSVEEISVVSTSRGLVLHRVTIMRADLERAVALEGSPEEVWADASFEGGATPIPDDAIVLPGRYPAFRWSVAPNVRQFVGDASKFVLYQVWVKARAELELLPGLSLNTAVGIDIRNNFDQAKTGSDSVLPRVRSDIREYLQTDDKLLQLQAEYVFPVAPDWFARVSAGIFEEMFGGVGGEILYRPFGSRFAAGIDLNRVWQRDFLGRFGFQDYSVTTGHATFYHALPVYDLFASLHVGQYLAGDRGATYALSRRFRSGVGVGVFATLTNVSAETFGEGSFDKGFVIQFPLDLFFTSSSSRIGSFRFRPLSRDGGQRLAIANQLFGLTGGGNLDAIARDWDRLLD